MARLARHCVVSVLSLLCFLSLESQTTYAQSSNSRDVIKVGVIQALTGIAAEDGKTTVQALKLAAEEINSKGQKKVELIIEDDQTDAKNSVSAFQKLRNDGVKVVVGATWSFTTNAIIQLAAQNGIVLINTSTIPECINLSDGKGLVFSNVMRTKEQARNFEDYVRRNNISDMVVVSVNNTWGESQRKIFLESAERLKVRVVDSLVSSSFDVNDWSAMIPRIASKKTQLVLLLLNKNDLGIFIRKARGQGIKTKMFASYHFYDTFKMAGATDIFNGVCFPYPLERVQKEPTFLAKYKEKYGEEPRIFADNSYDALFLIVKAAEMAAERRVSLDSALKQVELDGIVGRYLYSDESSLSIGSSSLICVEDGKLVETH